MFRSRTSLTAFVAQGPYQRGTRYHEARLFNRPGRPLRRFATERPA